MHAEFVGADPYGRFAAAAPHHEPGGLEVNRAVGLLADRPVNPQLNVRTHRQGVATLEGDAVLAHIAGDAVAPVVLHTLFRLPVTQREMNAEPCASAPLFGSFLHPGVCPLSSSRSLANQARCNSKAARHCS